MAARARKAAAPVVAAQPTITFVELRRLTVANSKKLPPFIELGGKRKHWTGIGWVDEGEPHGDEVLVVEKGTCSTCGVRVDEGHFCPRCAKKRPASLRPVAPVAQAEPAAEAPANRHAKRASLQGKMPHPFYATPAQNMVTVLRASRAIKKAGLGPKVLLMLRAFAAMNERNRAAALIPFFEDDKTESPRGTTDPPKDTP